MYAVFKGKASWLFQWEELPETQKRVNLEILQCPHPPAGKYNYRRCAAAAIYEQKMKVRSSAAQYNYRCTLHTV